MTESAAIWLIRTGCGERLRGTRLDVLPAVSGEGAHQIWIADGDQGEILIKIDVQHLPLLIGAMQQAKADLDAKLPPRAEWYGNYPDKVRTV